MINISWYFSSITHTSCRLVSYGETKLLVNFINRIMDHPVAVHIIEKQIFVEEFIVIEL
jgi:hypothetical protein